MPTSCFVTAANIDDEESGLFGGRKETDILWKDVGWVDDAHKRSCASGPGASQPCPPHFRSSNPLTDVGLFRMGSDKSKCRLRLSGCRGSGYLPEGSRPLLQGRPPALISWETEESGRRYFTDYPRIPEELNDQKVPEGEATERVVLATWLYIRDEDSGRTQMVDNSYDGRSRHWQEENVTQFILGINRNLEPYVAMYVSNFDVDGPWRLGGGEGNLRCGSPGVFPNTEKYGDWGASSYYRWVEIQGHIGFCYVKGLPILEGAWMATFRELAGVDCAAFGKFFAKKLARAVEKIVSVREEKWEPLMVEPEFNPLEDKLNELEMEVKMMKETQLAKENEMRNEFHQRDARVLNVINARLEKEVEGRLEDMEKKVKKVQSCFHAFRHDRPALDAWQKAAVREIEEKVRNIKPRSWWGG